MFMHFFCLSNFFEISTMFSYFTEGMTPQERMDNYGCDITYVTNSELGFDFLRDNLATVSSTSYAANISALAWSVLRDGKTLPSSTISGILLASAGSKLILNCCISCRE